MKKKQKEESWRKDKTVDEKNGKKEKERKKGREEEM